MRVANWAMGSSGFAITGPPPVREYRKALGSPAGARTTRGVACTRIRHGAAPGTGSAAVRGGRSEQNVSLNASVPLLQFRVAVTPGWPAASRENTEGERAC